jgi:hypothetical protein
MFSMSVRNLLSRACAVAVAHSLAAVCYGQYLTIPDQASPTSTPTGSQRVMLLSASDGSLVDANFIPQASSPYAFSSPKQAIQVGNEIWVSDGNATSSQIVCFTAVFNHSDPNPSNWLRPTWIRTISAGLSNIRGLANINDRVYVLNSGTSNGAPGPAVLVFQSDGSYVTWFPVASASNVLAGIDNLNGQLLITCLSGSGNSYFLYNTDGSGGGVFVDNSAKVGAFSPFQTKVQSTGPAGATEIWVAVGGSFGNQGIYRYDASGAQLAYYPVGIQCTGVYVLGNGSVLYTDWNSGSVSFTGGVKKFTPGIPPANPFVLERQTITITGTSGTYQLIYNGQQTAAISYPNSPATAISNLSGVGSNNTSVSGSSSSWVVSFMPGLPRTLMTAVNVTGDLVVSITETTVGSGTITPMLNAGSTAGSGLAPQYISPFSPTAPGPTNPYAAGIAAPSANQVAVLAGTSTLLTVTATPGSTPASTGMTVQADLSALGGSAVQALTPGSGNTFTYTLSIPASQAGGNYLVPLAVSDAQGRTGAGTIAMTVIAAPPAGSFAETEPNNTKATAQPVALTPGKVIWGTTTGASTITTGVAGADNYLVTTPAAPLGIYVHTINLTTSGTTGHTGTIRGLTQTSGGINSGTDAALETSSSGTTTPGYMVQWYGFGRQESVVYRVTGAAAPATSAEYLATYQTAPVVPTVVPGLIAPGAVTFAADAANGNNCKFAMCLYDANLNPVAGSNYASATISGGSATRTLAAGTYYLALSNVEATSASISLANNLAASPDSGNAGYSVLDNPNAVIDGAFLGNSSGQPCNMSLALTHGGGAVSVPAVKSQSFQVLWYKLYVGDPATPQVDGAAAPSPVIAGNPVQLTATVVPAATSTGLSVTANLGAFGGSTLQQLSDMGSNTFGFTLNVPAPQAAGLYSIAVTATDAQARSGSGIILLRVLPAPAPGLVVEAEPNDLLAGANPASISAGQGVYGVSMGAAVGGSDPMFTRDGFLLSMPVAAPGIYRNRMTITTSGIAGHSGSLRGRAQIIGGINPTADAEFQASSPTTSPSRFNQWYGFGRGEQMEYRVTGTSLTASEYVSTLEITPVTPIVVPGSIRAGSVTIARAPGNNSNTGMWIYDASYQPLYDGGGQGGGPLTRTLADGTYYLAVSDGNTANNLATPADSVSRTLPALAYPDSIANASAATSSNMNMQFTHAGGVATAVGAKTGPFDVVWYQFTVSSDSGVCCRGATCSTAFSSAGACFGTIGAGTMAGSVFVGSASACNTPRSTTSPCCYADYNKTGGITVQDIFDFLGDWFAGSPFANTAGTGAAGTLSVQNIFDFLGAWFAGGC